MNGRAPFGDRKGREIGMKGRAMAELVGGGVGVVLPW